MYSGVPISSPAWVAPLDAASPTATRAMPKSSTATRPSGRTITLDGLRSRWITPLTWAWWTASQIWPNSATRAAIVRGVWRR